jgi:hypothetical protein
VVPLARASSVPGAPSTTSPRTSPATSASSQASWPRRSASSAATSLPTRRCSRPNIRSRRAGDSLGHPELRERRLGGEIISTSFAESAVNQVISKRMVKKAADALEPPRRAPPTADPHPGTQRHPHRRLPALVPRLRPRNRSRARGRVTSHGLSALHLGPMDHVLPPERATPARIPKTDPHSCREAPKMTHHGSSRRAENLKEVFRNRGRESRRPAGG